MTISLLASGAELKGYIKLAAAAVLDRCPSIDTMALIGIQTRGVPLSTRLSRYICDEAGNLPKLGQLDINFYRDDLSRTSTHPTLKKTDIPFSLDGLDVFLIDDVLYTGRTIRSALDAIMDFGRPRVVRLLVLVDRGGRELPIAADWTAISHPVPAGENVEVRLKECDGEDAIYLVSSD